MKTIKILIAAPEELHEEKIQFSSLIEALNESLVSRGIELERVKWDPETDGSVEDFMEEAGECEMCLTLYWRELAENASEELTAAYQALKAGKNPQNLYVFFKEPTQDISEALKDFKANFVTNYGHFFCKFENVDTMNLQFILQFESYQHRLASADEDKLIVVKDGKVIVGEKDVVSLDNVPFASMNKEYQRLQSELAELDQQAAEARKRWKADPDDEDLEDEYLSIKSKRKKVADEFEKYQNHLYDIALGFAKRAGEAISERMLRAKEAFERGDAVEADNILNMEEMKRQAELRRRQREIDRKNDELTIEEFRLKADTVMANAELAIPDRFAQACEAYEWAIRIANDIHYDEAKLAKILFDYAYLLADFNKMHEAVSFYEAVLSIRRKFAESNPETFLPDLAKSLNNIAVLQNNLHRYDKAEQNHTEALSIRRQLADSNPEVYLPDVAQSLNNLAVLQDNLHRYEEAEKYYIETLSILRHLVASNPEAYLLAVAQTLNNLANLLGHLHRYEEAEQNYIEALSIRRQLADSNPEVYLPDVAQSHNNLAVLQYNLYQYEGAEKNYIEALSVYRQLANSNPEAYLPEVARLLNNLSLLQYDLYHYDEAESGYKEAMNIYRKLVAENAEAYQLDMAETLEDVGLLKKAQGKKDEAISAFNEALSIFEPFEAKNPGTYTEKIESIKSKLAELNAQ